MKNAEEILEMHFGSEFWKLKEYDYLKHILNAMREYANQSGEVENQVEVVKQRLHYHFSDITGGWIIPKNLPFMNEFLNEIDKLCNLSLPTPPKAISDEEILSKACSMFLLGKMTPSNEIIDKRYIWIKACKWMQKQIKNK